MTNNNHSSYSYDFIITEIKAKLNSGNKRKRNSSGESSSNETDPMTDLEDSWQLVDELEDGDKSNGESDKEPSGLEAGGTYAGNVDFSQQLEMDGGYITIYKVELP